MKLIQNSKFKINNFLTPIYLFLLSTIIACSSTTEVSKGNLTGIVNLDGLEDHNGIIVALYDLAYLDTTIVRINNQYPQIGVKINQHTEFDHRLQSPIKTTETLADGSFEITKISTGTYNLVAQKENFGFKYIYEIEINEGENEISQARCHPEFIEGRSEISELTPRFPLLNTIEGKSKKLTPNPSLKKEGKLKTNRLSESRKLSGSQRHSTKSLSHSLFPFPISHRTSDLILYPETHISGNISEDIIVLPDHHLIIDDDTVFIPNTSSLTIEPGAVIRINPGVDLTIHGNLLAQGEEDNMFWITSNHGFIAEERSEKGKDISPSLTREIPKEDFTGFPFPISRNSIELYNSMELSSIASVSDDLIEWGKWDYANTCLLNNVNNLHMQNGILRDAICGYSSSQIDYRFINTSLFMNCFGEQNGSIFINFCNGAEIKSNIFYNNNNAIKLTESLNNIISNNYFIDNISRGLWNLSNSETIFEYNEIRGSLDGISNTSSILTVKNNNIQSNTGINDLRVYGYYGGSTLYINYNNFNCYLYNVKSTSWYTGTEIIYHDASNNYWNTINSLEIEELIWDRNDEDPLGINYFRLLSIFVYEPFLLSKFNDTGIQL